jgi:hypothetical protein
MIILRLERLPDIFGRYTVCQDVMCGLDIEGLFDFGVRSAVKMEQHQSGSDKEREAPSHHFESAVGEVEFGDDVYIIDVVVREYQGQVGQMCVGRITVPCARGQAR